MIQIAIQGLEQLTSKLNRFNKGLNKAVEHTTTEAVIFVHANIPDYPEKPATSTYVRRHLLWNSITTFMGRAPGALSRVSKLAGEIQGFIGTKVEYAHWVIDKEDQTRVHKEHGWWNLQDVVLGLKGGITNIYQNGINRYVRSIFK